MYKKKFDPLRVDSKTGEVVVKAIKREIENILCSYVGWFDPFCELVQNGLDAIDERLLLEEDNYTPILKIIINIKENFILVTDNGIGFEEEKYKQFLAPNYSFKSGNTRGHKGVGATYLAYGFNYMQIATKSPYFNAVEVIRGARKWLKDNNPVGNPLVEPDNNQPFDGFYSDMDRGTSICVKFDSQSVPRDLSWIQIKTAENWLNILRVETGLGAMKENNKIKVNVEVIDKDNKHTKTEMQGIRYLHITEITDKCENFTKIATKLEELHKLQGASYRIPSKYSNLKAIYDTWTPSNRD